MLHSLSKTFNHLSYSFERLSNEKMNSILINFEHHYQHIFWIEFQKEWYKQLLHSLDRHLIRIMKMKKKTQIETELWTQWTDSKMNNALIEWVRIWGEWKNGMGYNDMVNKTGYKVKQWETKQNIWCRSSSNQSSINYNLCECPVCRHDIIE